MASFRHRDVFPVVSQVIREHSATQASTIGHKSLTIAFLHNQAGFHLVEAAKLGSKLTGDRLASNMVAWYSKTITTGTNPYQSMVERRRVAGKWAYRWCN